MKFFYELQVYIGLFGIYLVIFNYKVNNLFIDYLVKYDKI